MSPETAPMDAPSQAGSPVVPGRETGSHEVTVRVPATSANLGPGYDCLGLCLDLWDEVSGSSSMAVVSRST